MPEDRHRWLTLIKRRPDFRRLWSSDMVSQLGDWLSYIAVSLVAFEHGQGALALALVLIAHIHVPERPAHVSDRPPQATGEAPSTPR